MKPIKTALLLIVLLACNLVLPAAIPSGERRALIDLYNSTNGASWTKKANWLGAVGTESSWFGVRTDARGTTVLELFLQDNNLAGSLPASLGALSNLTQLYLHSNHLKGTIPPELGNLSNLQCLNLNINQLTGSLPHELGNLSRLQYLYLDNNQLTGSIPSSLWNLNKLIILSLYSNQLTGTVPPELGNLSGLHELYLSSNHPAGIISTELGDLSNLRRIELGGNELTGNIPSSLGDLSKLSILSLDNNHLTGSIPSSLGNLSKLALLILDYNHLTGSIPPELGNLSELRGLYLSSNRLAGSIPTFLIDLTKLNSQEISIDYNALYSSDVGLTSYLNSKNPDWAATQTIAPTNVSALPGIASVSVFWTPIAYTSDSGGYRIFYATVPGGPYSFYAQTANKSVSSQLVSGLTAGIPYYFVVQTRTDAHEGNQNEVDSENSAEVRATPLFPAPVTTPQN